MQKRKKCSTWKHFFNLANVIWWTSSLSCFSSVVRTYVINADGRTANESHSLIYLRINENINELMKI